MDLFGLVQTVVDLAKSHEEHGEEVKFFRLKLTSLQDQLQKLEAKDFQINADLQGQIKKELEESSSLLKRLPERHSYINTLLAKLPFGSVYNDIKDKSQALDKFSSQLNSHIITQLALASTTEQKIEKQQKQVQHVEEKTQIDPDLIDLGNHQHKPRIQLKLIAEDVIKQQFRMQGINTIELLELKCDGDVDQWKEIFKFGREYYRKLQMEVQQVQTISREHAVILFTYEKKEQFFELPQKKTKLDNTQTPQVPQEIFYTCVENFQPQEEGKNDVEFDYNFKLLNKSSNGVFYWDSNINKEWTRIIKDKEIQLKPKDKIALLMKKPEYKYPLIAYEFDFLT